MNIKKIRPKFTTVVTTMDKYTAPIMTKSGLIDTSKREGSLKEYQTVVAIGPSIRDIKIGDLVCINPSRYAVTKYKSDSIKDDIEGMNPVTHYNFNIVTLDGVDHLLIDDRDIDFIVEEWEPTDE